MEIYRSVAGVSQSERSVKGQAWLFLKAHTYFDRMNYFKNRRSFVFTDQYQTIIDLITSTKTKSGLTVEARLNKKTYAKGVKVSAIEMGKLNIHTNKFHGEWNYTIKPRK